MRLRHYIQSNRNDGLRLVELLGRDDPLTLTDLRKFGSIVDESEDVAGSIICLYGFLLAVAVSYILVLHFAFHVDTTYHPAWLIPPIFALFMIHYFWEFREDNFRNQIEAMLRCRCCGKSIGGKKVLKTIVDQSCPYCAVSVELLLGQPLSPKDKSDEPSDEPSDARIELEMFE